MSYVSAVLADSPSVFLKLDDATTAFVDSSGNGHIQTVTATITANQAGISGEIAASALFGGGRIDEDFGSATAYTDLTVEAWYNSATGSGTLWTSRGATGTGFTLFVGATGAGIGSTGQVTFGVDGAGVYVGVGTTATFHDGVWHHIVGTFSRASGSVVATDFKIYVDGTLQTVTQRTSGTSPTVPITPSRNWTIGQHPAGWGGGTLSATRLGAMAVYPTALNATQISTHWTEMSATFPPTRAAIVQGTAEALTVSTAAPAALVQATVEVALASPTPDAALVNAYVEALVIVQPTASFTGWGVPV